VQVRQGRRPRGRVAERLQNSFLGEKWHCERYMCALPHFFPRFPLPVCREASVSHITSIRPCALQIVGVLRALQTLMHADLTACVPRLSQVRNAMVRAAPRKADDRHLLRQCPQRAHRHHRCPTGLTPEAHHVSPRATPPSPPPPTRTRFGGWQAGGRLAAAIAGRGRRSMGLGAQPPSRRRVCTALPARCADSQAAFRRPRWLHGVPCGRRFAGVCVGSDFSFPEGRVGGVLLTRRRTCASLLHALPSPSSTDNMFTIGSVCIDRQGFHWKGPECAGEGHPTAQILKITV
jgi:hypothetical protein